MSIPIKTWAFCFLWLYSVSASSIESRRAPLTNPSPYAKWDCPFTVMKYSSVHDISISERAKEEGRRGAGEEERREEGEREREEGGNILRVWGSRTPLFSSRARRWAGSHPR